MTETLPLDDPTRLSTAPQPGAGGRPAPGRPLRRLWRQLTSMRTALLLLALLALAAIPGSLLPQRGLNPVRVAQYMRDHPQIAPLFDRLYLFDVFAAPWFAAIYLLLLVSLVGCLAPRIRLHARALRRRPPPAPRHLDRLPASATWASDLTPDEAVATAARRLKRARWRVDIRSDAGGVHSLGAEKGYLRETGNLTFHVALLVLLVGIALGGLFGYKGTVLVVEGSGFANVRSSYDVYQPARLSGDSQLAPFGFTLDRFTATYQPDGTPRSFDAAVTYQSSPDAAPVRREIRPNDPLPAVGADIYLLGHGYAPRLQVRDPSGRVVYDAATPFLPDDSKFTSHGVVKVPSGLPHQVGFTAFFYPTYGGTPLGPTSTYPAPRDPVLQVAAWRGDLGLGSGQPQSVYSLPVASMTHIANHQLTPGQTWRLPDGSSMTFVGVAQWATFEVAHDPGKRVVLAAAILIVLGLLASLRVRRRRVWVRALPAPADSGRRTVVHAGGLARTAADAFAEDFDELVRRMKD